LLWNLTGGARGGVHATDVTNASRTQLLNIKTLDWDEKLLAAFEVPRGMLPEVRSSSEIYGEASLAAIAGVPVAGILGDQQEVLARTVNDNGGVYFVPAFSGLFAPYWKETARGVIAGLTGFANKGHLARAVLEASAFQTREVIEAMEKDSQISLESLRVDGGMVVNELLMQFQADILNREVVRPVIQETTALGAAYAAGLAVKFFA